ncbi:MAG: binding-protein-dependent transport system inner membrane protein [bacterium]|nr:MAG: binding-protein-dependent transport system inner membrane protein [bacterium]
MRHRLRPLLGRHALPLLLAVGFLMPAWWVLVLSVRAPGLPPSTAIPWWPTSLALDNYRRIFELVPMARQAINSLIVVAFAVPLTIVTASWAGYAMANLGARRRGRFVVGTVILMLVPITALWLTRFVIVRNLGLMNTLGALVLPAIGGTNPFYVLLFYWTFRRIPRETFEAARLDGAGHWRVWARLAMPLARPTIVTVGVLAFSFYWSDMISPLLFLRSPGNDTLPLGLSSLQQMDVTDMPLIMAGVVVILIPVIGAFLLAHRYFWPDEMLLKPLNLKQPTGVEPAGSPSQ